MKKKLISAAILWCLVLGIARAEGEKSDGGFRWSWEKKRAVQTDSAQSSATKDKLLRQLMAKNRQLEAQLEEAEKNSAILVQEVQTAKRKAQVYAAAAAKAEATKTGGGSTGDQRYAGTVAKLLKENAELRQRVAAQGGAVPSTGSSVGAGSDLFQSQEQDKLKLKQRVQELTTALSRESSTRQELEEKAVSDTARIAELEKRLVDSENERTLLEQRQKKLLAEAGRGIRLENETEELKLEVARQEEALVELTAENRKKADMLQNAEQSVSALGGEREDLYFNMAVLYTTAEMYREAEQAFLKLLTLTPDAADVHYNLGILYDQHLKNGRKAVAHYNKYIELAPDSEDAVQVKVWLAEFDVEM